MHKPTLYDSCLLSSLLVWRTPSLNYPISSQTATRLPTAACKIFTRFVFQNHGLPQHPPLGISSPVNYKFQKNHMGVLSKFWVILHIVVMVQQSHQVQVTGHLVRKLPGRIAHRPNSGENTDDCSLQFGDILPQTFHVVLVAQQSCHLATLIS